MMCWLHLHNGLPMLPVDETGRSEGVTRLHEDSPCALGFHSTTPGVQEGVF